MKKYSSEITIGKTMLTGLMAGMAASLVCLAFDIFYRMETWYGPSDFINVSSIIFIVNLLMLVAGVIYYACKSWFHKGDLVFIVFFIALTLFCLWKTAGLHRFSDPRMNHEFIFLLSGTLGIIGLFTICIPVLFNNKNLSGLYYEEEV
jgi:hypothetical protein